VGPAVKYTLGRLALLVAVLLVLWPVQLNIFVKLLLALAFSAALSFFLLRRWRDEMGQQMADAALRRKAERERLRSALAGEDHAPPARPPADRPAPPSGQDEARPASPSAERSAPPPADLPPPSGDRSAPPPADLPPPSGDRSAPPSGDRSAPPSGDRPDGPSNR
jgi:Protein of unknown function (DUF4229)